MTTKQELAQILAEEFERGLWGDIDPFLFRRVAEPGNDEAVAEMEAVIERVVARLNEGGVMPKNTNPLPPAWGRENLRILTPEEHQGNITLSDDAFTLTGRLIADTEKADIHRQTAAEIFGVDPEKVTSSQRLAARAANFDILYGNKDLDSMIARDRAMGSDMPAIQAACAAYQRFFETADDPDPMIQFERRLLRQRLHDRLDHGLSELSSLQQGAFEVDEEVIQDVAVALTGCDVVFTERVPEGGPHPFEDMPDNDEGGVPSKGDCDGDLS